MVLADIVRQEPAHAGPFWGYSFADVAIAVVIVAAVCGLVYVALRQFEIAIPGWVQKVFWIVVCAVVVIFAIRLVASL